jgi:hypothetical protein
MGRRIAVSSIIRHVPPIRTSGLLRVVELDGRAVLLTARTLGGILMLGERIVPPERRGVQTW